MSNNWAPVAAPSPFVSRQGAALMLYGSKFRFAGPNIPWIALTVNGTYYPVHAEIDEVLAAAQTMGARVVRSHTLGISIGSAMCIKTGDTTWNDAAFEPIDYAIKSARDHVLRLVIPLVDNWEYYYGGRHNFTTWAGVAADNFWTDATVIAKYKEYIARILNHVNQYTGIRIGDDPTIMAWETGNELNPSDWIWTQACIDWTADIATYIKRLAPWHLVVDGHHASAGTVHHSANAMALSGVDIYKGHSYPLDNTFAQIDADAVKAAAKVYIQGEYEWNEFNDGDTLGSFLAIAEDQANNYAGDLYWEQRIPDILGGGDFRFVWPGDTQDMITRGKQLQAHAFGMRGLTMSAATVGFTVASADASAEIKAFCDYVCDGVADQEQINAALAGLPATGGIVQLSGGRFSISGRIVAAQHNTTLQGVGAGDYEGSAQTAYGTRIAIVTGYTDTEAIRVQATADTQPVFGVTFRDFCVDGGGFGTAVNGILWRSNRGQIDNVYVWDMTGWGLKLLGYASWSIHDNKLQGLHMGFCDLGGAWCAADSDDQLWSDCIWQSNVGPNCLIESASHQFNNCHFYDSLANNIKILTGSSRTKFSNCKIEGAYEHGVLIDTAGAGMSDIQFVGCGIHSNGQGTHNTYDNFHLVDSTGALSLKVQIIGCTIGGKSSVANKPRYSINISESSVKETTIVGNTFNAEVGTAYINDAGPWPDTAGSPCIKSNQNLWKAVVAWNPASIAVGAQATTTYTFTGLQEGVKTGDSVILSSAGVSLAGLMLTGYISAANVVTLVLSNLTAGAVDLASINIIIRVERG